MNPKEIKLSPVRQIKVGTLKPNPLNKKFFNPTPGAESDWLYNDINKRGIIDPLIAKKNRMLLTGHRRLIVAKQLSLDTVPVRFVEESLTEEEEIQFLVKDNVLRRHLDPLERKKLYYHIIPNFDELLENTHSTTMGINQKKLAEDLGLNPKTVGYDLSRYRHEAKKKRIEESGIDIPDGKAISRYKKACAHMLNTAMLGSKLTLKEFKNVHKSVGEKLDNIQS